MAVALANQNPVNLANLDSLTPITFSITGGEPGETWIFIWVRYEGSDEEIGVFDGSIFLAPFLTNSSFMHPQTPLQVITNFSVIPEGGWVSNVASMRIEFGVTAGGV